MSLLRHIVAIAIVTVAIACLLFTVQNRRWLFFENSPPPPVPVYLAGGAYRFGSPPGRALSQGGTSTPVPNQPVNAFVMTSDSAALRLLWWEVGDGFVIRLSPTMGPEELPRWQEWSDWRDRHFQSDPFALSHSRGLWEPGMEMERAATGKASRYRVIWPALAMAMATTVAFSGVGYMLVVSAVRSARARRIAERVANGQCVTCGYATAGTNVCPECGGSSKT